MDKQEKCNNYLEIASAKNVAADDFKAKEQFKNNLYKFIS
jgi:hypothetical protein